MQTRSDINFTSAAVSDRGLSDKRPQNEDSYLELRDLGVFAVADGVGGAQAGDVASQMAVEILAEAFTNQSVDSDPEDVMRRALERANAAIFQMANDLPQLASMATTVVALHLSGNIATIGHVGDSRLYRIDRNKKLNRETDDHSVVEEEVRAGRMTAEQALNHPSRNVISRALGAEAAVDVDLKTIMVTPGTTFLLCSDGITRHVSDSELEDVLSAGDEPHGVTTRLKELCFSRGAEDNLTAIVVGIPGSGDDVGQTAAGDVEPASGFEDFEEDTVATARVQPSSAQTFDDLIEATSADDESYLSEELREDRRQNSGDNLNGYASTSVEVPASAAVPATINVQTPNRAPEDRLPPSGGVLSTYLTPLLLVLTGIAIGAAALYLLRPEPQPQIVQLPPALVEKSPDISLTAFEESRRLIDKDPAAYINANAASPQKPEDYFLIGRAFLLTGKNWEAKRAFNEARNRLAEADPRNAKTLGIEIAMAIALIETAGASEKFSKDMTAVGPASNANTSAGQPAAR